MIRLYEVGCYIGATSTTSITIGTGLKTFTIASGEKATIGMTLRGEKTGDPTKYVEGIVIDADETTTVLSVKATGGSGTYAAWTFTSGTLRFSTDDYEGEDAPGPYEPVIAEEDGIGESSVSLHGDGRSFGAGSSERGWFKVINTGQRDHLRRYAYFGRTTRELLVADRLATYSSAVALRTGTIEQPAVSGDDVLFRFRGKLAEVEKKLVQNQRFPGTGAGGMSTVGGDGLKNRPRPLLRGFRAQIEPVPVNLAGTLRQISVKRINGVANGRNEGVPITTGTEHTTLAALVGASPTSGTFDWYDGRDGDGAWCLTPFDSRAGLFTLDAWEGETAADRYLAQVWKRTLIEDLGYTTADIEDADITTLDTDCPWECGFWAGAQEMTGKAFLDGIVQGVAGYYDDDFGKWRIAQDNADAGTPELWFIDATDKDTNALDTEVPYIGLELVASRDETAGLPVSRVNVEFAERARPLSNGDFAGDASSPSDPVGGADVRAQLSAEALVSSYPTAGPDTTISAIWGARELPVRTSLRFAADAAALALRLFGVHSVLRDVANLTAPVTAETAAARPGVYVGVRSPRYGMAAGRVMLIVGRKVHGMPPTMLLDLTEAPS